MEDKDKEFYDKAFTYFTYHAEQRTTMINFFIAVFGASAALYGSLILQVPMACILVSAFLLIISIVFYLIDIRNRLHVKQSQSVICAFEEKYGVTSSNSHAAFGVFSNEGNIFILYDAKFRKTNADYAALLRSKKKLSTAQLDEKVAAFVEKHPNLNAKDVKESLFQPAVPHLSNCIKFLYCVCMSISAIGLVASIILCLV